LANGSKFSLMLCRDNEVSPAMFYSRRTANMLKLVNFIIITVDKTLGVPAKVLLKLFRANPE
jgi:hypothetical protein